MLREAHRRAFPLLLALFNSLGLAFAVGVPTYIDPLYESPIFGKRHYPAGFLILLLAIPVFIPHIRGEPR